MVSFKFIVVYTYRNVQTRKLVRKRSCFSINTMETYWENSGLSRLYKARDDVMSKELHALYFEVKHEIQQGSLSTASGERERERERDYIICGKFLGMKQRWTRIMKTQ